jgi:DNA-directed RNA polymerase subunit RPC12/RpoP
MFSFLLVAGAIVLAIFLLLRWLIVAAGRDNARQGAAGLPRLGRLADCPYCGGHRRVARQLGLGIAHVCASCRRELPQA